MTLLREALSAAARAEDGWATSKRSSTPSNAPIPSGCPSGGGYTTDLGLIDATGRFDIRKVDRPNAKKVPEIRAGDLRRG